MKRLITVFLVFALASLFGAANTPVTTTITAGITADALEMTVASVAALSPMTDVMIDNEMVLICSVNTYQNKVRICSYGRGRRGTTAAVHNNGATVLVNPWVRQNADGSITAAGAFTAANVFVAATDPVCTATGDVGKIWFDITTTTTAVKFCLNAADTVGWSAVTIP